MEQKNIALELLVRSGNPKGVEQFAESERFDEARRTEKVAHNSPWKSDKWIQKNTRGLS